jgi:hypothetical protein
VAIGHEARAGNVAGGGTHDWEFALAELRRQLADMKESGDLPVEVVDENMERANALEEELGREAPRRSVALDLVANLARAVEGVTRLGDAITLVTGAVRAVFSA